MTFLYPVYFLTLLGLLPLIAVYFLKVRPARRSVTAFAYIMHEDRPIGVPSNFYMRTCLEGYDTFYFDKNILLDAYDKCREVCGYEG